MKNKKIIFLLIFMVNFFTFSANAQIGSVEIDSVPQNIRTLNKNYKEKYLDDHAYNYAERSPSLFARVKQWIIAKIVEFFNTTDASALEIFTIIKRIFYIIVLLGVIFILIKIYLNKEMRWIFKKKSDSGVTEYKSIAEQINEVDFRNLIEKASGEKDYRLAIRYYYLWLLKGLDKSSLISYDVEKTNFDYQSELLDSPLFNEFKKASYYYSYIWYGEFLIGEKEFQMASLVYINLLKKISNV